MAEYSITPDVSQDPISFYDYYNQRGNAENDGHWVDMDPDNFLTKIGNFFTGTRSKYKADYDNYLDEYNRMKDYELSKKADENARKFDEAMANTQFQRAYKDLLTTGFNPRLLLTQNFSASAPTAGNGFYKSSSSSARSSSKSESETNSNSFNKSAIVVALLATVMKMLL